MSHRFGVHPRVGSRTRKTKNRTLAFHIVFPSALRMWICDDLVNPTMGAVASLMAGGDDGVSGDGGGGGDGQGDHILV